MPKTASLKLLITSAFLTASIVFLTAGAARADHVAGHDEIARGGVKALEQRVWDLEQAIQNLQIGPGVTTVDCDTGGVLQATLDNAVEGDRIEVTGTCTESIRVLKDRIEVVGMPGARISGEVRIRGDNVTIRDFSDIRNTTGNAIVVDRGGAAVIDNNNIAGLGGHGVFVVKSSFARIIRNTITGAADHGVIVTDASSAEVLLNTITGSGDFGVYSLASSSARVDGNTITGNRRGLVIARSSTMRLSGSGGFGQPNILQNTGAEVDCTGFSSLRVDAPQTFLDPPTDFTIGADCKLDGNHGVLP